MPNIPYLTLATHLSLALLAGFIGWKVRDADYQAHLKQEADAKVVAVEGVREAEARNEVITQDTREDVAQKQAQVQVVYRTVTKEIPVYVTQTKFEERVVADGGLPLGLVWSYNQSASNSTAPLPPGTDPDTPTGIGVSALAGTTAGNFAVCHSWREELQGWHAWYNRLEAEWPGQAQIKEKTHDK